jgi:hypothetical protein
MDSYQKIPSGTIIGMVGTVVELIALFGVAAIGLIPVGFGAVSLTLMADAMMSFSLSLEK